MNLYNRYAVFSDIKAIGYCSVYCWCIFGVIFVQDSHDYGIYNTCPGECNVNVNDYGIYNTCPGECNVNVNGCPNNMIKP